MFVICVSSSPLSRSTVVSRRSTCLCLSLYPLYPDLLLSVRGQPVCVCLFVSSIQDYYRQLEINLSVSVSLSPLSRSTVVSWKSTCLCLSLYPPLSRSTVVSWRSTCLSLSLYLLYSGLLSSVGNQPVCLCLFNSSIQDYYRQLEINLSVSVSLSPLFRTTIVSWKSTWQSCMSLSYVNQSWSRFWC